MGVCMKIKTNNFIHYNMALAGGIFGGFAVCNLGEVFGNAQTLNLISIVYNIFFCDFSMLWLRIIAALLYFIGFALAMLMPKILKLRTEIVSIFIDISAFIVLALLPKNIPHLISLYPIFFATAFQWTAFEYIEGYSSSTIFSSNNYRQFATSLIEYFMDRDKSRLIKTRVFGLTLLYFHIGVALSCAGSIFIGKSSALIGVFSLIPALVLIIKGKTKKSDKIPKL